MQERALDVEDRDLVRVMIGRVRLVLRYHKGQGAMRPVPSDGGGPQGWELVH